MIKHTDAINAFMAKLKLWSQRVTNDDVTSFPRLNDIIRDGFEQLLKPDIICHLQNLQKEFERYFPEINTSSILLRLARNPFICEVEDVPQVIQEEFIELTNDSFAGDQFRTCDLEKFWVKMQRSYPRLGSNALKIIVPFSSIYLCECGFSALLTIKSKARNRLDVESDIRCALSAISPDIENLVANKQGQPSH
ncbi:protein FAM200A-like [Styela clava]